METTQIVWAALVLVFLVVEAATAGLTSIWFAIGAASALILSFASPEAIVWQVALFIAVSAITLAITRPLAKKYVNTRIKPTNADRVIGRTATVTSRIDNLAGTGEVSVEGRLWSARGDGVDSMEAGALVTIKSISGVKLFVSPLGDNTEIKSKEAARV